MTLIELAEWCETADAGCVKIDGLILKAIEPHHYYVMDDSGVLRRHDPCEHITHEAPRFTTSIDAALRLVPHGAEPAADAAPLAIVAASLRARAEA